MRKVLLSLLATGAVLTAYLMKSSIGIYYESMWFIIAALLITASLIINETEIRYEENNNERFMQENVKKYMFSIAAGLIVIVLFVKFVYSPIFMSERYVQLVKPVDMNTTGLNTSKIDTRGVTKVMSQRKANYLMGKMVDGIQLGSRFEINMDSAFVQNVNGELVIVLPLDYSGFFKWFSADSIPGYILVSATDPKAKPRLVLGKNIKVSRNGFFGGSIDRLVWLESGLKDTKTHFEIDDKGNPYYITAVLSPKIGFNANNIDYMLITDAQTRVTEKVSLKDISTKYPWIDRVWPEDIIQERMTYFGSLQKGWRNKVFTGLNVSVPTSYAGQELALVKANGVMNWITGMTSTNEKDTALTYFLIAEANSNSAVPVVHKMEVNQVFDESAAIRAITSRLGSNTISWKAVLPQPYMRDGHFYWVASIISKDKEATFQKRAYIDGEDKSNVSFGSLSENVQKLEKGERTKATVWSEIEKAMDRLNQLREEYNQM